MNATIEIQVSKRVSFPEDEARFPWLPLLLDAYTLVDQGVVDAVEQEVAGGRKLACAEGCAACCRAHKSIPVYPMELMGLSWYATEKIMDDRRDVLKKQLVEFQPNAPCPFLVHDRCAVHPLRPIACRQFNVFTKPCAEGEDPYFTRRGDVLTPIKRYVNEAFFRMLPFYGMKGKMQRRKAVDSGEVHKLAILLQECRWGTLAGKMDRHETGA